MLESYLEAHRVGQAAGEPTLGDVHMVEVTLTEVLGHFLSTINKGVSGAVGSNEGKSRIRREMLCQLLQRRSITFLPAHKG